MRPLLALLIVVTSCSSLFAQALGTRVPVSEKRLEKFWREKVLG